MEKIATFFFRTALAIHASNVLILPISESSEGHCHKRECLKSNIKEQFIDRDLFQQFCIPTLYVQHSPFIYQKSKEVWNHIWSENVLKTSELTEALLSQSNENVSSLKAKIVSVDDIYDWFMVFVLLFVHAVLRNLDAQSLCL